jgi:hypothetical protein
MGIFNFGNKQRLHTQLYGNTTGREMFKVEEYNKLKATTIGLSLVLFAFFTIFYFLWKHIPLKVLLFMIIVFLGLGVYLFFNVKQQRRLRENLYN